MVVEKNTIPIQLHTSLITNIEEDMIVAAHTTYEGKVLKDMEVCFDMVQMSVI